MPNERQTNTKQTPNRRQPNANRTSNERQTHAEWMMYEIPVETGILTRCNRNVKNIFQNLKRIFKKHISP